MPRWLFQYGGDGSSSCGSMKIVARGKSLSRFLQVLFLLGVSVSLSFLSIAIGDT